MRRAAKVDGRNRGYLFLLSIIDTESCECIEWPFHVNLEGYPRLVIGGKYYRANRVVCELAHGKPRAENMHAAHSCGKRNCVNPNHIRWATPQDNIDDKKGHGTQIRGEALHCAKLTEDEVKCIKARLRDGDKQAHIAKDFGVSKHAIHKIASGRNWGWVNA